MRPQQELDFSVPVQPIGSPLARHCSSMGAKKASEHAAQQAIRVLEAYRVHGPLMDAEVEKHTGYPAFLGDSAAPGARKAGFGARGRTSEESGVRRQQHGFRIGGAAVDGRCKRVVSYAGSSRSLRDAVHGVADVALR